MASIESIEGVGVANGKKLRKYGIRSCEALLRACCTKRGRRATSELTGIGPSLLLEWANRADLMRVRGVGSEYSDLLEQSGVDTVKELRRRNASSLTKMMSDTNDAHIKRTRRRIVRRAPAESEVARWIQNAKELDPLISH